MTEQLAYSQKDAARMLGMSVSHFQRHVRPNLPTPTFVGGRVLFKHEHLAAWLRKS